ncbi:MAG: helix-turn-helix transcriptional regulator [Cytophagaceae bacterium]|nr:helix-turn-helix transcriptional regulator [Cytophagaceae bacterium]
MQNLIQNIRTIRKQKGISQESVAYDLDIDYSTYGKIERGQIALTVDRLQKISKILGVTVEELYQWHEISTKPSDIKDTEGESIVLKELRAKLHKCQLELEAAKREVSLIHEQLKDKEKIIELLENKLSKPR